MQIRDDDDKREHDTKCKLIPLGMIMINKLCYSMLSLCWPSLHSNKSESVQQPWIAFRVMHIDITSSGENCISGGVVV